MTFLVRLIVLFCAFNLGLVRAQQSFSCEQQWDKTVFLAKELNELYVKNGFSSRVILPTNSAPTSFFKVLNRCQAISFGDAQHFAIDFKKDTLDVLEFYDWTTSNSLDGPTAPLYAIKPISTWSQEKAASLAQECALIFFPEMAKMSKFDGAIFLTPNRSGLQYKDGQWTVVFRRQSKEGYLFKSDYINIQLAEQTGPFAGVMRIPSHFEERPHHPITKEQASLAATKAFAEFRKTSVASWVVDSSTNVKVIDSPKLEIVDPMDNNAATLEDYIHSQSLEARLAWVIRYSLETPSSNSVSSRLQKASHIELFVDAENGHLLGAEF